MTTNFSKMKSQRYFFLVSLLIFACLLSYFPAMWGDFFVDDYVYVVDNSFLQNLDFHDIFSLFISQSNVFEYLPLRDLSYWLDLQLFGLNPLGFHFHNLALYGLSCFAVWLFSIEIIRFIGKERLAEADQTFIAFTITAIFTLHPAHVESVAWISGRKDLLSGLFAVLSCWQFTRALNEEFKTSWRLVLAIIFFVFALMSKSTVIALPMVIFILLLVFASQQNFKPKVCWKPALTFVLYGLTSLFFLVLYVQVGKESGVKLSPFSQEIFKAQESFMMPIKILGQLTDVAFAPFNLRLIYDLNTPAWKPYVLFFLGLLVALLFFYSCIRFYRARSLMAFGVTFFVIFCLPFLQIIPFKTWSIVSERFLFLPVLGMAIIVSVFINKANKLKYPLIGLVIFLGFILLIARVNDWQEPPESLWLANAQQNPHHFDSVFQLVNVVYLPNKEYEAARTSALELNNDIQKQGLLLYIESKENFSQSGSSHYDYFIQKLENYFIRGNYSGNSDYHGNSYIVHVEGHIAEMYEAKGDFFNAARYYYRLLKNRNQKASIALNAIENNFATFIDKYKKNIEREPANPKNYLQLGGMYLQIFQIKKARDVYQKGLESISHDNITQLFHYNLGLCGYRSKHYEEAIEHFEIAYEKGMINADLLNNLGLSYMHLGMTDKAEAAFINAMNQDPLFEDAAYNLGSMKLSLGQVDSAITTLNKAKKRMEAKGKPTEMIDLKIQFAETFR